MRSSPVPRLQVWMSAGLIVGSVDSPTRAYAIAREHLQLLSLHHGTVADVVLVAAERMILRLEHGEVVRAVCPATITTEDGVKRLLLFATDRRLLGDGEGRWQWDVPWSSLDGAWPRHDRPDLDGSPGHELVIDGVAVQLDGWLGYREAMIAAAWRGIVESEVC